MLKNDGKTEYFEELTLNLRHESFTAGPEEDGLLPVDMDGQHLCRATETGGVRYWREDVAGETIRSWNWQRWSLSKIVG